MKKLSDDDDAVETMPTQGFNIKSIEAHGFKLHVWDIGGQTTIRKYWRNYYENTDCIVYVVDSGDVDRLDECAKELSVLLKEKKLTGVPLLVFANKQDLVSSLSQDEIAESLGLLEIEDRAYQIASCSGKTGEGLTDGLEWVVEQVNEEEGSIGEHKC